MPRFSRATPFADDSVDVCLSSNVAEHVAEPWRLGNEMLRVLTYIWREDGWGLTAVRRFPRGRQPQPAQMAHRRGPEEVSDRDWIGAGADAIYSTTRDMARFTAALLGGGANQHGRILEPPTLAMMFAPHFQPDPRISGMGDVLRMTH